MSLRLRKIMRKHRKSLGSSARAHCRWLKRTATWTQTTPSRSSMRECSGASPKCFTKRNLSMWASYLVALSCVTLSSKIITISKSSTTRGTASRVQTATPISLISNWWIPMMATTASTAHCRRTTRPKNQHWARRYKPPWIHRSDLFQMGSNPRRLLNLESHILHNTLKNLELESNSCKIHSQTIDLPRDIPLIRHLILRRNSTSIHQVVSTSVLEIIILTIRTEWKVISRRAWTFSLDSGTGGKTTWPTIRDSWVSPWLKMSRKCKEEVTNSKSSLVARSRK